MTRINSIISRPNAPWLLLTNKNIVQEVVSSNFLFVELQADQMVNLEDLFREFSRSFNFPNYFGNNLNALDECINDLEWLPSEGYVIAIENCSILLAEESDNVLKNFLCLVDSAGKEWAAGINQGETWDREAIPFHTILVDEEGRLAAFRSRLKSIGFKLQQLDESVECIVNVQ